MQLKGPSAGRMKPGDHRPFYFVLATRRALGIRFGDYYFSDGRNLVLESRGQSKKIIGPVREVLDTGCFKPCDPLLEYPLVPHAAIGKDDAGSGRYLIPKADRTKVLARLWLYVGKPPRLSATRFDLIAERFFKVGDFIVIRQCGSNFLLSPHGGAVIDWAPASWGKPRPTAGLFS